MIDVAAIKRRYEAVSPVREERGRRRFAGAEALTAGWSGIAAVSEATGIARSTIGYGLRELRGKAPDSALRGIWRKGAGRKPLTETDPTLLGDLERLAPPGLGAVRHRASGRPRRHRHVAEKLGYSLQANRKTLE